MGKRAAVYRPGWPDLLKRSLLIRHFSLEELLPELAEDKNIREQITLCMKAAGSSVWETVFD